MGDQVDGVLYRYGLHRRIPLALWSPATMAVFPFTVAPWCTPNAASHSNFLMPSRDRRGYRSGLTRERLGDSTDKMRARMFRLATKKDKTALCQYISSQNPIAVPI